VRKLLVLGLATAAAVAVGVTSELQLGGKERSHPLTSTHARHFRDGPAHGLMLLPLADPDGRLSIADRNQR
jgi:hypothetical protein